MGDPAVDKSGEGLGGGTGSVTVPDVLALLSMYARIR